MAPRRSAVQILLRTASQVKNFTFKGAQAFQVKRNKGFAVSSVSRSPKVAAYALAQCWENLNTSSCAACLSAAAASVANCAPVEEGRGLFTGCFIRYFDSTFLELRGFCVKVQLKETGCSLDSPEFLRWCHSCTYHLSIGMAEEESSSGKRNIIERLVLQARPKLRLLLAGSALYLLQLLLILEKLQVSMALTFLQGFLNQVSISVIRI